MIEYENLKKTNEKLFPNYMEIFKKFLDSGWYILGNEVKEFERDYIEFLKAKHSNVLATLKSGKLTDKAIDTLVTVAKDLSEKYN